MKYFALLLAALMLSGCAGWKYESHGDYVIGEPSPAEIEPRYQDILKGDNSGNPAQQRSIKWLEDQERQYQAQSERTGYHGNGNRIRSYDLYIDGQKYWCNDWEYGGTQCRKD